MEKMNWNRPIPGPDAMKPAGIDKNFFVEFQNRTLQWKWIVQHSIDPRARMLNTKLSTFNAVGSLLGSRSFSIHIQQLFKIYPNEIV